MFELFIFFILEIIVKQKKFSYVTKLTVQCLLVRYFVTAIKSYSIFYSFNAVFYFECAKKKANFYEFLMKL